LSHLVLLPILLPLLAGVAILPWRSTPIQRAIGLGAALLLVVLAGALLAEASAGPTVYRLGGWEPPLGIVLVLDRLGALLVAVTAVVGLAALVYAAAGNDRRGRAFHPLFQFQLAGLNGAFLTGDFFNLFVFFEILLIASYGLLLHGGGGRRNQAAFHYVILNLVGSMLFLMGLGILYGTAGTLNMADLARVLPGLDPEAAALARAGGLLLLAVFALKAAAFPLFLWLPEAYSAALPPVAALFAVMTKVGIYAILRLDAMVLAPLGSELVTPLLLYGGIATVAVGALGALGAQRLGAMVSYLLLVSVGTLLMGVAIEAGVGPALYYLVHTTLLTAGLFLLVGIVSRQRAPQGDILESGAPLAQPVALGVLFLIAAVGIVGLPPLSGFLGKVLILQAFLVGPAMAGVFAAVLVGGLGLLVALGRAGSTLFWKQGFEPRPVRAAGAQTLVPAAGLILATAVLAAAAGPIAQWTGRAAAEAQETGGYIESVLGAREAHP